MRFRFRLAAGALLCLILAAFVASRPDLRYYMLGKLFRAPSPAALVQVSDFDWRRVDASVEGTAWIDETKALVQGNTEHPECVELVTTAFRGTLCATRALEGPYSDTQSGFRSFFSTRYPDANLFDPLGWNFEHILSTAREDYYRNDFSPRIEQCSLVQRSPASASLFWSGEHGEWPFASELTYTLGSESSIDIDFRTALLRTMPRDVIILMWASYMRCAQERAIHFWGVERDPYHPQHYGDPRWIAFGESRDALGG
ncbi:MAG: hypothetical protein IT368_05595, partial [Candidatus Hydrogenedentes bacterium]|nr:hypothetical protein [Candidatus Hydrogenedentota bacterium]